MINVQKYIFLQGGLNFLFFFGTMKVKHKFCVRWNGDRKMKNLESKI